MGKQQRECTIITMVLIMISVLVITIKLTSCSFDTHMFSSKHNPIRMTLVKYSYGTAKKHEMKAAPLCEQYACACENVQIRRVVSVPIYRLRCILTYMAASYKLIKHSRLFLPGLELEEQTDSAVLSSAL